MRFIENEIISQMMSELELIRINTDNLDYRFSLNRNNITRIENSISHMDFTYLTAISSFIKEFILLDCNSFESENKTYLNESDRIFLCFFHKAIEDFIDEIYV